MKERGQVHVLVLKNVVSCVLLRSVLKNNSSEFSFVNHFDYSYFQSTVGALPISVREEFFHDLARVSLLASYLHGGVSAFSSA